MRTHDFLEAAQLALAIADDFRFPALGFGVTGIHPAEVTGEEGSFGPARARAHFEENIALVVGVLGQEEDLQFFGQCVAGGGGAFHFLARHAADLGIAVLQECFRIGDLSQCVLVAAETGDERIELRVFAAEGAEAVLIVLDFRFGEQGGDFLEALGEVIELMLDGCFH